MVPTDSCGLGDHRAVRACLVIVSFGSASLLRSGLELMQIPRDTQLVIVENGVTPEAIVATRKVADEFGGELIESGANIGYGAAVNLGLQKARHIGADVAIILNPDAYLSGRGLEDLAHFAASGRETLYSPRIVRTDGSVWFEGGAIRRVLGMAVHRSGSNEWLSGACLAFSLKSPIGQLVFSEAYFLYWEDVDFSSRWVRSGGEIRVEPSINCIHDVGGTQARGAGRRPGRSKSLLYLYQNSKNRLRYSRDHNTRARRLVWVATTPLYILIMLRRFGLQAEGGIARAFSAVLRGTVHGMGLGESRELSKGGGGPWT